MSKKRQNRLKNKFVFHLVLESCFLVNLFIWFLSAVEEKASKFVRSHVVQLFALLLPFICIRCCPSPSFGILNISKNMNVNHSKCVNFDHRCFWMQWINCCLKKSKKSFFFVEIRFYSSVIFYFFNSITMRFYKYFD